MLKPVIGTKSHLSALRHQDDWCPTTFTVLNWNVAKCSRQPRFKALMADLMEQEKVNFVLLQEARTYQVEAFDLHGYSWAMSPNIETRTHYFGVVSAFNIHCEQATPLISHSQELFYATHKSALVTHHNIRDREERLLVVNLHAINFVLNRFFYDEMASITQLVEHHKGPLIVAGDFNTWNAARVRFVRKMMKHLSLEEVMFEDPHHIKRMFRHPLDYIFCRGMQVERGWALDAPISDHNPVLATLTVL